MDQGCDISTGFTERGNSTVRQVVAVPCAPRYPGALDGNGGAGEILGRDGNRREQEALVPTCAYA